MGFQMLEKYRYNGARSLVLLHEVHLISCVNVWIESKKLGLSLPNTEDSNYESLESLIVHILRAARGYMTWICEKLDLPDPGINKTPGADKIESQVSNYTAHLLEKWRLPLPEVSEDRFNTPTYTSRWGIEYCIDAMLEHAVMHPIRHEFQLHNLITQQRK